MMIEFKTLCMFDRYINSSGLYYLNPYKFIEKPSLWRQGFVWDWKRCNKSLSYTKDILSVVDVHRYLSKKGLQVLVER